VLLSGSLACWKVGHPFAGKHRDRGGTQAGMSDTLCHDHRVTTVTDRDRGCHGPSGPAAAGGPGGPRFPGPGKPTVTVAVAAAGGPGRAATVSSRVTVGLEVQYSSARNLQIASASQPSS
jgi:hypothetical protein